MQVIPIHDAYRVVINQDVVMKQKFKLSDRIQTKKHFISFLISFNDLVKRHPYLFHAPFLRSSKTLDKGALNESFKRKYAPMMISIFGSFLFIFSA
ncbi:hypothetical protein CER18_05035 [Bartonella tribocorum]|uniref:Uncharacterized protein n=1 Tax=Bartonella tribocorum TaxID=85701 RepID=A0A2M6US79_9HYPH|nr:hypothetical protein CER18_05035 [Bartonella tribocorum]